MSKLSQLVVFFFLSLSCYGQVDKEFWFAAPELQVLHGDDPIVLRITAQSKPVNVTITLPADTTFQPISITVAENSSKTVDLTPFKAKIEHTEKDIILKKGINIKGDELFSCYYDIPDPFNGDLFALKGRNALGFQFTVPFQRIFSSYGYPNYTTDFIIVATENNTKVTITPTQNLLNHPAGIPFTITLNKGETFACQNASNIPSEKPGGTKVIADKKVAITTKDDSLFYPGYSCGDTVGDQLIPDDIAGVNFIIMKGRLYANDYYYVYAIQNNTIVKVNNSPVDTLNAGEYYVGQLADPSCYIESSKPIHVFHISGFGCELGGAIVPALKCTGSTDISITRATNQDFFFNVLATSDIIEGFTINENNSLITASQFSDVPSTNGIWKFARITIPTTLAAAGQVARIRNTLGKFHLGVIHGDQGSTTRYGYFSDFSSTTIRYENYFPPFCLGAPISKSPILIVSADNPIAYQWYRNTEPDNTTGTPIEGATDSAYTVPLINNTIGTTYYYVKVQGQCGDVTSPVSPIIISPLNQITTEITQPNNVCIGDSTIALNVNATGNGTLLYQWYVNNTNNINNATKIPNATLPTYKPQTDTTGTKFYFAEVLGTCGGDTSSIIQLRIEDCDAICTHDQKHYGAKCDGTKDDDDKDDDDKDDDDKDDDDKKDDDKKDDDKKNDNCKKQEEALRLIEKGVKKWYDEVGNLKIGGMNRFVLILNTPSDYKAINQFLPVKKQKSFKISSGYTSFDQLNRSDKEDKNGLLAETITLALNIGNNWKLKSIELKDSLLSKKLNEKCNDCEIDDDENKSNGIISIKDEDKDGKITIYDVYIIANKVLNGEETSYNKYEIARLICIINHVFKCDPKNDDDDDDDDDEDDDDDDDDDDDEDDDDDDDDDDKKEEKKPQSPSNNTSGSGSLLFNTYPNPITSQFSINYSSPVSGIAKIEFFDLMGRKIKEISQQINNPNQVYTNKISNIQSNSKMIVYRIRVGNLSKNGIIIKH